MWLNSNQTNKWQPRSWSNVGEYELVSVFDYMVMMMIKWSDVSLESLQGLKIRRGMTIKLIDEDMDVSIHPWCNSLSLSDVDEGQELLLASVVVLGLFCIFIHIFHIDIQ